MLILTASRDDSGQHLLWRKVNLADPRVFFRHVRFVRNNPICSFQGRVIIIETSLVVQPGPHKS